MAGFLESFTIARTKEGYVIQIEDDDGNQVEVNATFDQLELIEEELERHLALLDQDVVEEDEEEEPLDDNDMDDKD